MTQAKRRREKHPVENKRDCMLNLTPLPPITNIYFVLWYDYTDSFLLQFARYGKTSLWFIAKGFCGTFCGIY
jgi:hypothetical protein